MEKISIWKLNHSVLVTQCDPGVAAELNEYFSFFVPGYKFMPAFKNRVWDGKIRLYNSRNGTLPAGLFYHLLKFCEQRDYELDQHKSDYGDPDSHNTVNVEEIANFLISLNLPYAVRDYQFNAICTGIHSKRRILVSPTGSGKSFIIYCLLRWYLANFNKRVLVIVPTTSLVEQMYADFNDYAKNDEFDAEHEIHRIYSGRDKNAEAQVYVSTWQSIYKFPLDWFSQFGAVFGDECHGFKSKSLTTIMDKCTEAEYRFGTTGTLDGSLTHELVLQGLFGRVLKVTTTRELQDNDTLAKLEITRLVLNYNDEIRKQNAGITYQDEIEYIVTNKLRNNLIRNLALDQNGNTLVLFQYVEKHGKVLFDIIESKAAEGRKVFFVSGQTETADREAIRKITEKQKDAIIVASLGTFSTGINIRNLHNIIFASPSKSQIRVLQSIGRGLRKSDDGRTTKLYDITDDMCWKGRKNFCFLHSTERLKMYQSEKFDYKTYGIDINGN